jgi:hypothetical protein
MLDTRFVADSVTDRRVDGALRRVARAAIIDLSTRLTGGVPQARFVLRRRDG